jgi:hypothetical protein
MSVAQDFHGSDAAGEQSVAATIVSNDKGPAAKTFELADGTLVKKSAAQIYKGEARCVKVAGLGGLLRLIKGLRSNEALTYGVPEMEHACVVTQKAKALNGTGAICRDREHFDFLEGRPGVFMLDYDPRPGHAPKSARELDAILCETMPELAAVTRAWRPSSTSYIYTSDDDEIIGAGGLHGYLIVDDASEIPLLGATLYQRLWAAGHGYIQVSKSGALLDRSIVDAAVWQPERLDFVAPPVMGPGLNRWPPRDLVLRGEPLLRTAALDLGAGVPTDEWRRVCPELLAARRAIKPEADKVRRRFATERVAALKAEGVNIEPRVIERAVTHRVLGPEFVLYCEDGGMRSVGELLADPKRYDRTRYHDPLEFDYAGGDGRIAIAFLLKKYPCLFSHTHGGQTYTLGGSLRVVEGGAAELNGGAAKAEAKSGQNADSLDSEECDRTGGGGKPNGGAAETSSKPVIFIKGGSLSENADEAERIFAVPMWQCSGGAGGWSGQLETPFAIIRAMRCRSPGLPKSRGACLGMRFASMPVVRGTTSGP